MENNLYLTFDEASALLEMSLCSTAKTNEDATASALTKLAYLYRDLVNQGRPVSVPAPKVLRRAA